MAYLASDKVKMYPSSYRIHSNDPESYLNTESNLTQARKLSEDTALNSYVIESGDNLLIYIDGYMFKVSKADIIDLNLGNDVWAYIKLINDPTYYDSTHTYINTRLDNIETSGSKLDTTGNVFQGISFVNVQPDTDYCVRVFENGAVPSSSKLKLKASEVKDSDGSSITEKFTTEEIDASVVDNLKIDVETDKISLVPNDESTATNITLSDSTIDIKNKNAEISLGTNSKISVAANKTLNVNAGFTVGSSSNTGSVTIKSSGAGSTTIIGPNNGTINLPSNAVNKDVALIQNGDSTSLWKAFTEKDTASTIMSRDANGASSVKNLSVTNMSSGTNGNNVIVDSNGNIEKIDCSVSDPTSSGTSDTFIDSISQASNGKITATKKGLNKATNSQLGVVKSAFSTTVTAPTLTESTTENRYYGIKTDTNGTMFVNVPWLNTEYTFSTGSSQGAFKYNDSECNIYGLTANDSPTFSGLSLTGAMSSTSTITAVGFDASSDYRLKENIKDYDNKHSILDLSVKEFDYKNSDVHTIGFIAQDLQELYPELVDTDKDGYLSIRETKLVYLLIDEVKKLKERIDELERR